MSRRRSSSGAGQARRQRSTARMHAVQAVYQLEINEGRVDDLIAEFQAHRLGHDLDGEPVISADREFFSDLVAGCHQRRQELDQLVESSLSLDYAIDRLEMLLRALLRVAAYELLARIDVPARVVIDEYVDLSHAFFNGAEPSLANAVLDRIARKVRADELSKKVR
ncbi:transcription antitermination factor NusB [Minwuia sp.]|uniref:transcription antitermination factor NusB n=1 Tax=Minwuia sp. TaxID=2493630 RepID=UPI003A8DB373